MTTSALPALRGSRHPQWLRAARRPMGVYLVLWAWMWAVCLVGVTVAIVLTDRLGTVELSVAQFIRNGPLVWFLFSVGVIIVAACLTPHVANGMTRRSFVVGTLTATVIGSLLFAAASAGILLLEGVVYDRMGWGHHAVEGDSYTAGVWEAGVGTLLLDHALVTVAGSVTGLLVGVTYYRLGGWWGTLALPLTLLPILAAMFTTTWSRAPFMPTDEPEAAVYAVHGALVLAAGLAFVLLTRRAPITRTES